MSKEHGKLNYMSLEELNYIFGVPTAKHIQYQLRHVLPWALAMVKYRIGRLRRRKGEDVEKPYIEKMYYWVAVKDAESSESQERTSTAGESKEADQEHREVVGGAGQARTSIIGEVETKQGEEEHREVADWPAEVSGALDSIGSRHT